MNPIMMPTRWIFALLFVALFNTMTTSATSPLPGGDRSLQLELPRVARFNFRFGFFEGTRGEPNRDDVLAMLCQTQYFFSRMVQDGTGKKSVTAEITDIDWAFSVLSDAVPLHANFTVRFNDADAPPEASEADITTTEDEVLIQEMDNLSTEQLQTLITDWIWEARPRPNFFANTAKLAYDGKMSLAVEGAIDSAYCPETPAPSSVPTISPAPTIWRPTPQPSMEVATGFPTIHAPTVGTAAPVNDESAAGGTTRPTYLPFHPPSNTKDDWPFDPFHKDISTLKDMVHVSLLFGLKEEHEKAPQEDEVNSMVCQLNQYLTRHMRGMLNDNSILSKAAYIDWYFDDSASEALIVNFTSYNYNGQDGSLVPAEEAFEALKLDPTQVADLVQNYVWKSEPLQANVFYHTERIKINIDVVSPEEMRTKAMLIEGQDCPIPTMSPTVSPHPTVSPKPSPAPIPTAPAPPPGKDRITIQVAFKISNLEEIVSAALVNASGLIWSFPILADEVVHNRTKKARNLLRSTTTITTSEGADGKSRRRRLKVVIVPGTSKVAAIEKFDCPQEALPGLTCHSAVADYDILVTDDEDEFVTDLEYTDATQLAIDRGVYQNILEKHVKDTPLYIGIMTNWDQVPPGSKDKVPQDEDGISWWYILMVVLLVLLCLCCLCGLWLACLPPKDTKDDDIEVEEELAMEETTIQRETFADEPGQAPRAAAGPVDPVDWEEDQVVPYDPGQAGAGASGEPLALPPSSTGELPALPPSTTAEQNTLPPTTTLAIEAGELEVIPEAENSVSAMNDASIQELS